MYFDIKPKTDAKDLFGIDFLLRQLVKVIRSEKVRMIVIKGLRRTGKTSLLNIALKESRINNIKIDVRESPYYDKKEFSEFLIEKIKDRYLKALFPVSELKFFYGEIGAGIKFKERKIISFFEKLNHKLKKKKKQLIIALDEAQLLKKIEFNQVLASIYDNYGQIKIMLTGSEIGVLDEFIGRKVGSPLFGRPYFEIEMKKFEKEKSAEFLIKGFEQIKKQIEMEEIEEVIGELDGVVGWLSSYGWFRTQNINHRDSLRKTIHEGEKLAKEELENFLRKRKARANYLIVLKALTKNKDRWEIIKNEFIKKKRNISDRQFLLYLNELTDYSFIEKKNKRYSLSDPLYARALV